MDLSEQARRDPRVGDKWADNRPMMGLTCEVVEVHEHTVAVNYCGEGPCGMTKRRFIEWISGWSLIERGPAPAVEKPERDPRIDPVFGDELKCTEGHTREVGEVGKNGQGYECVWYDQYTPGGNRYIREVCSLGEWREINRGAEILAYGDRPAPAAPSRDPCTQPVVGDEWTFADQKRRIRFVIGDDLKVDHIYSDGTFNTFRYTTNEVASYVGIWKLHRRGDDPAWRPPEERVEPPAAGIKVGDRVRHFDGDEGTVEAVSKESALVRFDGDAKATEQFFEWLTIIPPADAPDPIEDIDRNPHADPHVGDEWECDLDETNRVVALSDIEVCLVIVETGEFFHYQREQFVDESAEWRLSKAADQDPDDTGDEPPTPEPNFFREHGDDDIETNANSARQSRLDVRCDLLPPKATLHCAAILRRGAEKYGDKNYLGISTADHLNHALTHVLQYLAGDVSEDHLGNAACRMLFALETKAVAAAKGTTT